MKDLEKYLKVLSDGMKTLAKGFESVAAKVDALAKTQGSVKPAEKTTAEKTTRKPATKSTPKKAPEATRKAPSRKAAEPSATETVYQMIRRYKNGVDTATVKKNTGYSDKKVHNIIYKLKKQGKIKSTAKGVYVKS